ncbi:hypothetical protein EV356DRAFT_571232 [Viridothelium virens]|uniref:Uncharacterized protein n=1 Tax=Viridothelium virens TaxID=1048519 RepID=A0A6A6GUN8_VIRVR|nr:hypothetical protein EV356DRAFT_571232 [Viridothelium virens]
MAVKTIHVWIYSFCPIDLRPFTEGFFAACQTLNLRVEDIMKLDVYDDVAPGSQNKVQRLSVVNNIVSRAKWELDVDLGVVGYVTLESQQAESFNNLVHDFRVMSHAMQISASMGGVFIPIVLHYDNIEDFVRQAKAQGLDMPELLKNRGLVVDVRGKESKSLGNMMYDHVQKNQN